MNTGYMNDLFKHNGDTRLIKRVIDSLNAAVWYKDFENNSFWVSSELANIYGYTQEDFQRSPETWKHAVFPGDLEVVERHIETQETGRSSEVEYRIIRSDGEMRWIQESANLAKDEKGKVISSTGVVKDITERKMANIHLAESTQRYDSLFEHSENGLYSLDLHGYFKSCNTVCEQLTGYRKEELVHRTHFRDLIVPEERARTEHYFGLARKGMPQSFRTSIGRTDGSIVHLSVTVVPTIVNGQIDGIFGVARDITQQVEVEKSNEYMAYHDYLTGLPNRNMLYSCLSKELMQASEKKQEIAVLFIDLDRFKVINDTLGHHTGDLLLKEVKKWLEVSVDDVDMIFRQGGDEFIVVLTDTDRQQAAEAARRMMKALAAPIHINGHEIFTSASIGISLFPEDGKTVETLLKHADHAMYQAKRAGKKTYAFYSSNERKTGIDSLKIETELHKAIERDQLFLHYQPKVNLKTGRIVGMEALLRWHHPEWGIMSPRTFIPVAEETGLIIPIGEWALRAACKQNKAWQQKGFSTVMSVNLSARQFNQTNLAETVAEILDQTGLEPHYLGLEITESMTMDITCIVSALRQLKKLGVRISIDDFGIGFSSLNYLKQFPIDTLKIDQSFVKELYNNPSDDTIVKAIISMAHNLNLNVVAEGIETKDQLVFLQQHFCDEGQGYFFSEPLPADELEEIIQEVQQKVQKYGIPREVNEQMWAEELLRMAKKDLQDTVRLQQGMTMKFKKINGRFIHTLCDGELLYRFGLIPSEVVGKELYDFLPYKHADKKIECYQRAWEGEEFVTYEDELNGIHYLASLRPVRRGGEVVEVIASCVDITDRKRAEEALRESEYKYRLITENISDIVMLLDQQGTILYASPSLGAMLGSPSECYKGKSLFELMRTEGRPFAIKKFKQAVKDKSLYEGESYFLHSNGSLILCEGVATPVMGRDGEVEHFILVGRDITEKRKAEELLLKSEKLSVVGELAAGVAHEIRNPLTAIRGFIQLFQQGITKPEFFHVVFNEFDRVEDIIKEFLSLAKPQEIRLRETDIQAVLKDVEILIESESHLQNVQIAQEFEPDIPLIMCDGNQIKQVFINLIKNSIEALPNGGFVKIEGEKEGDHVVIRVRDNGMGISEERLQRLGEPFFSNKEKGTGLGLMLCFRIIRQHHGTIHFKSKENEGTTVEIRLPIKHS